MELVKSYSSESGIVKATTDQSGISMMMNMRKLALHPLLMRYYYSDDDVRKMAKFLSRDPLYKKDNPEYIFEELAYLSDFQLFQLTKKHQVCIIICYKKRNFFYNDIFLTNLELRAIL